MTPDDKLHKLLFKYSRISLKEHTEIQSDDNDVYKRVNAAVAALDSSIRQDILSDLEDLDLTSLDADELEELMDILQNTSVDEPSTVDLLLNTDFNEIVDNGNDTFLNEKPSGKMKTSNMVRQKHKMGVNALPKAKLKAARIKNRLKNLKNRIAQRKYYKQNKATLKRYSKSYNAAVKAGKHQAAIRRKS